ncbi:virulence factor family protein [Aureimonas mangrovi]|uniref:virulence factor family protein n=1 Tax=Aureimonas mangrovi TaxID=2758041 RepID=UPI00163DCAB4|nr:virulence factor family protein [Aureimonas mangrovi]
MTRRLRLLIAGLAALAVIAAGFAVYRATRGPSLEPVGTASSPPLANISILSPGDDPDGLVILVSDRGGIAQADRDLAARLLDENLVVLPVDLEAWRGALNTQSGTCVYLGSAIEGLAKDAQRALDLDSYFHPVVAGRGEGGALALAAVADAPAATMAGGVSLGAAPFLSTTLPVCAGATPTPAPQGEGGFSYDASDGLPEPFLAVTPGAGGGDLPPVAPGPQYAVQETGAPAGEEADQRFAEAVAAIARADASALPVVDLPPDGPPIAVAVFFSGDGGWRDLDKISGEWLQAHGVHVIGVDSLRYFWSEKTPEAMAADIAQIVQGAAPPQGMPVALLGYSFGADTLPFAFAHLPGDLQDRVSLIGLLAPGTATGFEISVGGWLGFATGENEVVPAIEALPPAKVLCVYGRDEDGTACTNPALSSVAILGLDGGHHFDGDYPALAARLLAAITNGAKAGLAAPSGM